MHHCLTSPQCKQRYSPCKLPDYMITWWLRQVTSELLPPCPLHTSCALETQKSCSVTAHHQLSPTMETIRKERENLRCKSLSVSSPQSAIARHRCIFAGTGAGSKRSLQEHAYTMLTRLQLPLQLMHSMLPTPQNQQDM